MKIQVCRALNERNDPNLRVGANVVHTAQNSKIDRAIPEVRSRVGIGVWNDQLHLSSHLLGEIGAQRLSVGHGKPVTNDRKNDWLVLCRQRHSRKNTQYDYRIN